MDVLELAVLLAALAKGSPPPLEIGGKATNLSALCRAGLPVPEALVIAAAARSASAEDRERLFEWLATAAEKLGGPLAVRSSAALEDGIVSAAPGVFASILDVAPDRVASAVRAVWASADTPLVRDYAGARGIDEVAIAVIVQRQVGRDGSAVHGVMYTRQPGRPDSDTMLLEVYRGVQTAGHGEAGASTPQAAIPLPRRGSIPPQDVLDVQIIEQLRDYALGAEEAIGARSGADVEWVLERCDPAADSAEHARLWLVQARPIVHPPERAGPRFPLALLQFSRGEPERVWRLDAAHNPDPLSPAQTGIVEYLDRAGVAPYAMRVVGGYLYTAETAATGSAPAGDLSGDELWQRFDSELRPAMDSAVGRAAPQAESVQVALAAYRDFYRIYTAELTPLISRAKAVLPAFLDSVLDREDERDSRRLTGELVPQALWSSLYDRMIRTVTGESSLADLAEYVAPLAPAWDVASATFAETPDVLHRAVAGLRAQRAGRRAASAGPAASDAVSHAISLAQSLRAEIAKRRGADAAERFDHCRELAVVAYRIGDLDDHLYASAQAMMRRALLAQAEVWQLADPDDVFFLPLDSVLDWAEHGDMPALRIVARMAGAGRAAWQRQRAWAGVAPAAFADGAPLPAARPSPTTGEQWRGRGCGARAQGTAMRLDSLDDRPEIPPGTIVVVQTVTPAMVFVLQQAVAFVAEHGGLLGHGAAMARELGIPCVVDCPGAWTDLASGDHLQVDGDAGVVTRLGAVSVLIEGRP